MKVKLLHFVFGTLLLSGFLHSNLLAQNDGQIKLSVDQLDKICLEAQDSFQIPGFAVGVIENGKVIFAKGYGVLKKGHPDKVNADTRFAIASNTKAFVGTAVAMLEAKNKLKLTDKASNFLPYLKFSNPAITSLLNVEDLLTHRTGLGTFKGDHLWYKSNLSPKEVLKKVPSLELEYPFRSGYGYSNVMFIAAGEVIKEASGNKWTTYIENNIIQPLKMTNTVTSVNNLGENTAYGHISRMNNTPINAVPWETSGPAGGIWSSVNDMLKWAQCNLDSGTVNGVEVYPQSVQKEVWSLKNTFSSPSNPVSYGLGWFLFKENGSVVATHSGGYDGMYSRFTLIPNKKVAIVVLTNSMTGLSSAVGHHIRKLYNDTASEEWLSNAMKNHRRGNKEWFARQSAIDEKIKKVKGQPNTVIPQPGIMYDGNLGEFVISGNGPEYMISFPNTTELNAKLIPKGGDVYEIQWQKPSAWFNKGIVIFEREEGQKYSFTLDIPNDDIFFESIHAFSID